MGLQISKLQKNFKRLFSPFSFEHMKSSFQFFKTFCEILLQNCMKLERENFGRLCHVLWNMYIILAFSQKNMYIVTILLFLEDLWLIKAIGLSTRNNWFGLILLMIVDKTRSSIMFGHVTWSKTFHTFRALK